MSPSPGKPPSRQVAAHLRVSSASAISLGVAQLPQVHVVRGSNLRNAAQMRAHPKDNQPLRVSSASAISLGVAQLPQVHVVRGSNLILRVHKGVEG
eukprot:CAMPEP_0182914964 /NCGR_PEP_ID=MMETSP0034_2-20130328/38839_1 /TAXON_ID=156128 /ORGANISM="Nephroselmis pyriformis, Strain CCMP717" /LENGTH=95 /DNA_ID=CAMNT_0025051753 /DNA_START=188 /DNA_END=476 /DNA_ORIENTATION=-